MWGAWAEPASEERGAGGLEADIFLYIWSRFQSIFKNCAPPPPPDPLAGGGGWMIMPLSGRSCPASIYYVTLHAHSLEWAEATSK